MWGALLILFSAVVLVHIQSFPSIPGQKVGPALFPGLIAVGLAICALMLITRGLAAHAHGGERSPWVELEGWTRQRRYVIAFAAVIGVNVLYIAVVDKLGFIPTAIAYLGTLFGVFRVRAGWIVPLAIAVTLVIHYAFYKLLRVPLPWGILERFAW